MQSANMVYFCSSPLLHPIVRTCFVTGYLATHPLPQTLGWREKEATFTSSVPTPCIAQSSPATNEIVTTVADYENASPDQLPPLEDNLDSETYHQLVSFESELTEPLTFEYLWYQVTVLPEGEVVVTP